MTYSTGELVMRLGEKVLPTGSHPSIQADNSPASSRIRLCSGYRMPVAYAEQAPCLLPPEP